jgi:hypothetical protein
MSASLLKIVQTHFSVSAGILHTFLKESLLYKG